MAAKVCWPIFIQANIIKYNVYIFRCKEAVFQTSDAHVDKLKSVAPLYMTAVQWGPTDKKLDKKAAL